MHWHFATARLVTLFEMLLASVSAASLCHAAQADRGLLELSLEELGKITVTSVSRRVEPLADAPASIYVITAEDIRRSGVRTLPEALRLAPTLQVARLNASHYAISARGFNNAVGNKLLVLIDGRTVYTPLFSGVFWDMQDVMLEDVERIEVISGPGATLWGANAVNGVINVITRAARDTTGVLVAAGAGNRDHGAAFRYGAKLGNSGHFRVYGKGMEIQNTRAENGTAVRDEWQMGQVGFRADWLNAHGGFTVQGDAYNGKSEHGGFVGAFEIPPVKVAGANLLARWTRQLSGGSDIRLQAYVDHTDREDPLFFRPKADIFDIDFQQGFTARSHRIVWGGGYRYARDDVGAGSVFTTFIPASRRQDWLNIFVQDEIRLGPTLELTAGIKLERNDYTGWEHLPSVRLAWKPVNDHLAWAALSRAVRAPSRLDRDVFFPANPPFLIFGGPNFQSEVAKVIEIGYRAQVASALTYSITAFRHNWDKLRSGGGGVLENRIEGHVDGVEAWASYQPARTWRLTGGYTALRERLRLEPGSLDPVGVNNPQLANDPVHQWTLRSAHNFADRHELDIMLRHVSALRLQAVRAYTAVDARYAWRVNRNAELSITAENLFDPHHAEFGALPGRSEIGRAVFLKLVLTQ
jgi:iron complex outermembrane recepter protein